MHPGSRTIRFNLLKTFVLVVFAAAAFGAQAGEPAEAVLLVAKPELGAAYSHTVLIAKRVADERYLGLILNRPIPDSPSTHAGGTSITMRRVAARIASPQPLRYGDFARPHA